MTDYTFGCDVSAWQNKTDTPQNINYHQMYDAGARFVFIKASQSCWTDRNFNYSWNAAAETDLLRGAYHFVYWDENPRKQAEYFWSLIENDPGELPPVADYENYGNVPKDAVNYLWGFCDTLERLSGRTPIIYTNVWFFGDTVAKNAAWAKFPLWVASYTSQAYVEKYMRLRTPWEEWAFWQYTKSGNGKQFGVESLDLDMNYFNGSYDDLLQFAGFQEEEQQKEINDPEKLERLWVAHPELHGTI